MYGTSLAIQWLKLHIPNAGGMGSIPGRGTNIPHVAQHGKNNNNKKTPMLSSQRSLHSVWGIRHGKEGSKFRERHGKF